MPEERLVAIAKALADPRRLRILREVAGSHAPMPCCSLTDAGCVSPATISHHIRELEAVGLIAIVRDGKFARLVFQRTALDAYLVGLSESLARRP